MIKPILFAVALLASTLALAANPEVALKTNMGTMILELYPAKAPETVKNFMAYVKSGFYDGTIFHRVIDGFMIQGGGYDREFNRKATRPPIRNEAANGLKNTKYTVAMARTSDPQSATSQFFINLANNAFLNYRAPDPMNYGYCVFGKVVKGQAVVRRIAKVQTGALGPFSASVPLNAVVIEKVRILKEN